MATLLFITDSELVSTTILGGAIDPDKYRFTIESVQELVIEPLLGTELFDKIVSLVTLGTIGDGGNELYNTLYVEFVKKITKNESCARYLQISSYMVTNGGLFKHSPENAEVVDKDEAQFLGQIYSDKAQTYIIRFKKWICLNPLTEYKLSQDDVNATKDINLPGGWYLPNSDAITEDQLGFDE